MGILSKECGRVGLFLYHVGMGVWDLVKEKWSFGERIITIPSVPLTDSLYRSPCPLHFSHDVEPQSMHHWITLVVTPR